MTKDKFIQENTSQSIFQNNNEILLRIEGLKGQYQGSFGVVQGVNGVTFEVRKGDMVGIAGESGCGKSTLAELITGTPRPLLHFKAGTVIVDNNNIYEIDSEFLRTEVKCKIMSYVPQASQESLNPVKRIKDFIFDVIRERTGEKGNKKETLKLAEEHFKKVGLDKEVLSRYPHELSGGMKQRAVIAISTLWNPKLLIIDEPTSALDVSSQKQMIKMLFDLKNKGIIECILFVSHDIASLRQLCTKALIMYAGRIVERGDMDDIIFNPLHPYTKGLISSFVSYNPDGSRPELSSIPGSHPDLRHLPAGCKFNPRCPKCTDICRTKEPLEFEIKNENRHVKCWLFE